MDLFESLTNITNGINHMNERVTQNAHNIEAIKDSLHQITTILQQLIKDNGTNNVSGNPPSKKLSIYKGPSVPEEVNSLSLSPATEGTIKSIVDCEANYVGKGSFGIVYGGNYNGQAVAVKKLTQDSKEGKISLSI